MPWGCRRTPAPSPRGSTGRTGAPRTPSRIVSQSSPEVAGCPSKAPPVACQCRVWSMSSRTFHSSHGVWISSCSSPTQEYTSLHLSATCRQMSMGPLMSTPLSADHSAPGRRAIDAPPTTWRAEPPSRRRGRPRSSVSRRVDECEPYGRPADERCPTATTADEAARRSICTSSDRRGTTCIGRHGGYTFATRRRRLCPRHSRRRSTPLTQRWSCSDDCSPSVTSVGFGVRVGLHTGEATERERDVRRPGGRPERARLASIAHGGQILVSRHHRAPAAQPDDDAVARRAPAARPRPPDDRAPARGRGPAVGVPAAARRRTRNGNLPEQLTSFVGRDELLRRGRRSRARRTSW